MFLNRLNAHFVSLSIPILLLAASGQASMIGNPVVTGTQVDTCNGCTFVLLDPFPAGDLGFNVVSFSLFAFQSGNQITPLLFSQSGGNYTVSGVGTTQTIASAGAQTYSFGLTDGSSMVGASTYFGYRDGTIAAGNQGTIAFNAAGSGALIRYFGSAGSGTSPNTYVGEFFTNPPGKNWGGGGGGGGGGEKKGKKTKKPLPPRDPTPPPPPTRPPAPITRRGLGRLNGGRRGRGAAPGGGGGGRNGPEIIKRKKFSPMLVVHNFR